MALTLRDATIQDGDFLLAVRNDDDVRAQSKQTDVISQETHRKWLEQHVHSADTAIWIIEEKGEKLGYVRAERLDQPGRLDTWLLSIALHAGCRGRRYGTWAVGEACRVLRERFEAQAVVAEVLAGKAASLKLFQAAGFMLGGVSPVAGREFLRFELSLTP